MNAIRDADCQNLVTRRDVENVFGPVTRSGEGSQINTHFFLTENSVGVFVIHCHFNQR